MFLWKYGKSSLNYHQIPTLCFTGHMLTLVMIIWTASSEFGTYRLCEQRRFRRACASTQSRQNLRCSLIQAVSQEEPSDRKPDPWPLWMAGHAQLKFVLTECLKTQIHLMRLIYIIKQPKIMNLVSYSFLQQHFNEVPWEIENGRCSWESG